ncbi:MAG: cytochrome C oxidase subunit IV family protein [Nitriliruptorales bacterium]
MSVSETEQQPTADAARAHGHPTPRDYVNIAVLLGVLTAAEVATYFFELVTWALWVGLTGLALAKFALVVGYYMHLKYDSVIFRRLFVFGVVLAMTVFLLVLGIFALGGSQVTA